MSGSEIGEGCVDVIGMLARVNRGYDRMMISVIGPIVGMDAWSAKRKCVLHMLSRFV